MAQSIPTPSKFYNTLPLFADVRFYFSQADDTWFLYGNIGSAIAISNNFKKGRYWGTGVGYKVSVGSNKTLNISLGFNEQYIVNSETDKERIPRLGLRVGFQF